MGKLSLYEFTTSVDFQNIEDPRLILSIVEKMWNIPFDEMFHVKCRYKEPTPWEYIYEEFTDREQLVPKEQEAFRNLKYGEIALILEGELEKKEKAGEDCQPLDILIVFGRMYRYFA